MTQEILDPLEKLASPVEMELQGNRDPRGRKESWERWDYKVSDQITKRAQMNRLMVSNLLKPEFAAATWEEWPASNV